MTAQEFLRIKTSVPSELRTRQWSRVPLWQREQSFFMAGVANAVLLDAFRQSAQAVADGQESEDQALRRIREALTKENYRPAPGQEETIKDLRTVRRQLTTLRANVRLARGWAALQRQRQSPAFPATELIRAAGRKKQRWWQTQLWPAAMARRNAARPDLPALRPDMMMAPAGDEVWALLSDFGAPYDPLKYNTGMIQRPVGFRRALAAGIVRPSGTPAPDGAPPALPPDVLPSPGENLAMPLPGASPVLRENLTRSLRGLGEWQGDTLVFTDPNGTRPAGPEELARLLRTDNPDGSANYQLRALMEWAALGGNEEATATMRDKFAGRDVLDDFNRLLYRMQRARRGVPVLQLLTTLAALLGGAMQ